MLKKITLLFALAITTLAHASNPQLDTLFESDWQWTLGQNPELATTLGDTRYNHKLTNTTLAAQRVATRHQVEMLKEALKINRSTLSAQELISYDQFLFEKKLAIDATAFYPYTVQPVTDIDGIQITFPELVTQTPFTNAYDYHSYLARLHALPAYIDGLIEQMQQGIKTGWVAPKVIIAPVPQQLRDLRMHLSESELAKPFNAIPKTVPKPAVFEQLGKKE